MGIRHHGVGIPVGVLELGRTEHCGLPGIAERAREVGASLAIWSREGQGTEIELGLAGSIAYATGRSRLNFFGTWWDKT
jgi:signal transduction histidine kinase